MNFENLILAVAIGFAIWLLMRFLPKPRRRAVPTPAPAGEEAQAATMPRAGQPGTLTRAQIKVLRKNHFPIDATWSKQDAALILDTLAYLRAVCRRVGGGEAPEEVQNALLRYILVSEELREHVRQWAQSRRSNPREVYLAVGPEQLPAGVECAAVAAEAQRLLASADSQIESGG